MKLRTEIACLINKEVHLEEFRHDEEAIQKQLELVTLRLPAPRVGFWSRIFGGGKKKEE